MKFTYLTNLNLCFFFLLLANYKMNTETYGDFRLSSLHSENKRDFWNDSLFLNLYDFWCICRNGFLLKTYKTKNSLLKKIICRKVKGDKELPTYKVLLRKFMEGEEQFNPIDYLDKDHKDYFNVLKEWKKICGKDYLEEFPHLREPKRH